MKRYPVLLAVAVLWSSLSYAADSPFGPHERDSRLMLYVSLPVSRLASTNGPVIGLRFDQRTPEARNTWSVGPSNASFSGAPTLLASATLMDLQLSLSRQRDVRLNGMPLWLADESSDTSTGAADKNAKPTKPLWKRPVFWVVTGSVLGAVVTVALIEGLHDVAKFYPAHDDERLR